MTARLRRRSGQATSILAAEHGSPRHGNYDDPLDELLFIVLSQMTTQPSFDRVFRRLRGVAGGWSAVAAMTVDELRSLIADAGLSGQKAPRLLAILDRVRRDMGDYTLDPLASLGDHAAEAYLTSLPGVGVKTARCVLMYALGRHVLPADTHVSRVATRLGLVPPGTTSSRVHALLDTVVAPADRYAFHVNALAHGRAVCRARSPRCSACALTRLCPSSARPS